MLDERKAAILRAVVEEYIETAQPVGSGSVAPQVKASSATVRNEMVMLEQEGYLAIVCRDGPSALTHFAPGAATIDLVVLDLMLPGMSGYEICREIRAKSPHVPILVLSARTLSEDRAHAFDVGVDQYMTKPFALPELLSRCRNLLDRNDRLGLGAAAPPRGGLPGLSRPLLPRLPRRRRRGGRCPSWP